jgi:hypothetical protein
MMTGAPQSIYLADSWYVHQQSTGQMFGPVSEETIADWIANRQLSHQDFVSRTGLGDWVPIVNSPFRDHVARRIEADQLFANACPRCGAAMVGVAGGSASGIALIIIGVVLTPFVIGILFWIIGMIQCSSARKQTSYSCPRCKYTSI